ncbi:MAG: type III pantothenate kinase [Amylibacter sp.]|nr:type III pantothenate kinase [Amylibacter sp.]
MLLAIDCGNTNALFAVHDGKTWRAQWRSATETSRTADEYAVWLHQLLNMENLSLADIDACIISTVVPQSLFHMRNLSRRYLKCEPMVVGESDLDIGVVAVIDNPREVGADRLVNAVGARTFLQGALLLVDSGTATTFDLISAKGEFLGGAIAPGMNLALQALHEAAAKLPRIAIEKTVKTIGTNTVSAMQAGIFWGYVGLIDTLVRRMKNEYDEPLTVVGTGGVSPLFSGASETIDRFDPDLTVRGLLDIFNRNRGKV